MRIRPTITALTSLLVAVTMLATAAPKLASAASVPTVASARTMAATAAVAADLATVPPTDTVMTTATMALKAKAPKLAAVAQTSAITPPLSTFFATAAEESYSTYQMHGDGDLWPSCWSNDGNLYAANGDGTAFSPFQGFNSRHDMVVSRINGRPPRLTGTTLNTNVGTIYSPGPYNRKPTGMACVGNAIYLAFQNLNYQTFDDAPAASVAKSTDHGLTWTWDTQKPMFDNHVFTTIFFLDYGKNYAHAIDNYVYAYGFDNNWRAQQQMYLARVPQTSIQDSGAYQFYTGTDNSGQPTWGGISAKVPVLEDDRLLYPQTFGNFCCTKNPVLGQGGVTYDAPLKRYIFASWSFATHEIYEAPQPWGPWSRVLSKDFGPLGTTGTSPLGYNRGQYGTNIPSKFISKDGKTLYLQSNVCCFGDSYTYSLRKLYVQPYTPTTPTNGPDDANNLAMTGDGTRATSKSTHFGTLCGLNCYDTLSDGITTTQSEDDFDQEVKPVDWWGYTWNHAYNMNKVVYTTGLVFPDGGWYSSDLHVQVRQNFKWVDVSGLSVTPTYPYSSTAGAHVPYTFTFNDIAGDGVRIIGVPATPSGPCDTPTTQPCPHYFTSISELAVYYAQNQNGMPGGAATPELGSGELLATGLAPLLAFGLYRRRRAAARRSKKGSAA